MRARKKPRLLPKVLREKRRYAAVKVFSEKSVKKEDVESAIMHSLVDIAGEINIAIANVKFLKELCKEEKQIYVIRFSHSAKELVHAAIALVNRIGDSKVAMRIIGISGTIKALKRKFLKEL